MIVEQDNSVEAGIFRLAFCQSLSIKEKHRLIDAMKEDPAATPASLANRAGIKNKSKENYFVHISSFDAEKERNRLKEWEIHWISQHNPCFPEHLRNIYDSPIGLFCRGNVELLKKRSLSVVGSRTCTTYGKEALKKLLPKVIHEGYVIVSGLARGIDAEAHRTSIKEGGETIGVIGTGIDLVYPPENKNLQQTIGNQHLLVSEYPLGTKPLREHFPMRNRIIAGLSMGTLVIEARYRSGSLITANLALNEGREVFAVPGSVLSPLSEGTNDLIKHGAKCVLSADDILEEVFFSF